MYIGNFEKTINWASLLPFKRHAVSFPSTQIYNQHCSSPQTDRNSALESSLREYEWSTAALNTELAAMSNRAEEHADVVADLRRELEVMREAESQVLAV